MSFFGGDGMTEIGKCGTTLFSIDLLSCFGVGPICLMVTQSALDWRLGGKPGPMPCSAGTGASWWPRVSSSGGLGCEIKCDNCLRSRGGRAAPQEERGDRTTALTVFRTAACASEDPASCQFTPKATD